MTANFNQSFTKLDKWQPQKFDANVGIINVEKQAYIIRFKDIPQTGDVSLEEFNALQRDPQFEQLQALICQINYDYDPCKNSTQFGVVLEALCDAWEDLPNLKALFIGDEDRHEYRISELDVFDIRPILEAYPNLQVLQVRGDFDYHKLECESLKHEHLKTLIIETADLDNPNLVQICALELPALEYLELWLGRQLNADFMIETLTPILLGESFPNLSYLGLRSSEDSDQIAEELVKSPILERLTVLDLSMGNLSDSGAEALLNCPAINKLYTLNIANNGVSESTIQKLLQLDCQVIADNQEVYCGEETSRYIALHRYVLSNE